MYGRPFKRFQNISAPLFYFTCHQNYHSRFESKRNLKFWKLSAGSFLAAATPVTLGSTTPFRWSGGFFRMMKMIITNDEKIMIAMSLQVWHWSFTRGLLAGKYNWHIWQIFCQTFFLSIYVYFWVRYSMNTINWNIGISWYLDILKNMILK